MTVVLAEDDVDIRDLVQIVLEQLDLEVKAVGTGAEALAVGQQEVPRLFLLDITMPGMNGLEVTREVTTGELRDLLLGLDAGSQKEAEILELFGAERFIEAEDAAYDELEEVARAQGLLG